MKEMEGSILFMKEGFTGLSIDEDDHIYMIGIDGCGRVKWVLYWVDDLGGYLDCTDLFLLKPKLLDKIEAYWHDQQIFHDDPDWN